RNRRTIRRSSSRKEARGGGDGDKLMKVGIMGGTFDPIHIGHLVAADAAAEAAALDEVWFIPSAVPPLKSGGASAGGEGRLALAELASAGEARFRAVQIERGRGGVSYTIDTVSELAARYPEHRFHYIIGAARINDLAQWHRIEHLAALVSFIG